MALNTGVSGAKVKFTNAFNVQGSIPLDARTILNNKNDLLSISDHFDVNGNNVYLYPGIIVYCKDTKEELAYIGPVQDDGGILITDAQTLSNWKTVINGNSTGDMSTARIVSITPTDTNTLATYKFTDGNGNVINGSATIDIPKDKFFSGSTMGNMDDEFDSSTGAITKKGTGNAAIELVYTNSDGTYSWNKIDVQDLIKGQQFGNGLAVNEGVVSIVSDGVNDSSFLAIGEDTIGLSGITKAIKDSADALKNTIDAYTVNTYAISSNPVLNGADIKLNGYSQSTATDESALTLSATDTVNIAFGKLSKTIADNEITIAASLNDLNARIVADKEIEGQTGEEYSVNTASTYISGATDMNNADVLLDSAIKVNSDSIKSNKLTAVDPTEIIITEYSSGSTIELGIIDAGTY